LICFADDFVIIFEKNDADRVMAIISKRFEKFGLTVHPDKTKLVDFRTPHCGGNAGTTVPLDIGARRSGQARESTMIA